MWCIIAKQQIIARNQESRNLTLVWTQPRKVYNWLVLNPQVWEIIATNNRNKNLQLTVIEKLYRENLTNYYSLNPLFEQKLRHHKDIKIKALFPLFCGNVLISFCSYINYIRSQLTSDWQAIYGYQQFTVKTSWLEDINWVNKFSLSKVEK